MRGYPTHLPSRRLRCYVSLEVAVRYWRVGPQEALGSVLLVEIDASSNLAVRCANLTLSAVRRASTAPRLPRRHINEGKRKGVRPDALDLFAFATIVEMAENVSNIASKLRRF